MGLFTSIFGGVAATSADISSIHILARSTLAATGSIARESLSTAVREAVRRRERASRAFSVAASFTLAI